ncbi:glycolipid transfer protein [Gonapodya prolifera JEL478]|uniref:Glycolipid transfer protein n=1 Tax=Gonapodya prolifera (strain JEL478) TaxID=1344416 RepID=A0A139AB56_GONPJ|nr:glycolipid transfer protein [Gonapodya prolifera JEL478]|eukprot:KXS14061.1 glycolipid transfer protein [Gonapodya prolifera JEL478]
MTYFDRQNATSYVDVSVEPGIEVNKFLLATEEVVGIFRLLNATAFAPVISDMNGNIKKIRDKYNENPSATPTLQSIIQDERAKGQDTATVGMQWLFRGLCFTSDALRDSLSNPSHELAESFTKSYEGTLKPYHGFLVKGIFTVAMKACPYRKDFFLKLGPDVSVVEHKMEIWLQGLEKINGIMCGVYKVSSYRGPGDYP